jgi:hypothetical protein
MRHTLLRTTFLIAVVTLVCGSDSSYGRGPGGGGGRAGGRAGGGGNRGLDMSKRDLKNGDRPNFSANGGLNGAAKKFQGAQGQLLNHDGAAQQKWQSRNGKFQQSAQSAFGDFKNGPQPFTADWYADHPAAWQATHPHADAWAVASATGVAAWLGWAAYPETYGTSNTTVVYQETPADETEEEPAVDDQAFTNQTATPQDDAGDWLALGVYSVVSNSGEPASRLLQLAVNRQGELRGVYFDTIANTSQNLSGRVDQATQEAQWSIDSNAQITFRANLDQLTQPTGTIEVTQPAGAQQWHVARQQNAS